MENAAKALIIVATTILGVLLFSIMIYMFRAGARVDEQYDATQAQRQLELKNSKFEVYNKNNNTIMDLITVANLAYSNNVETDYDDSKAIEINIKINGKEFIIPKVNPNSTGENFGKNEIIANGTVISIYDLADKTLKELGISNSDDKLSKSYYGKINYTKDSDGNPVENGSKTGRVYKYLFKCSKMSYYNLTGTVESMNFELNTDIDSNSEIFWKSNYDE